MTSSDDWRRAATAHQMRSVEQTIDPSVAHIARIQDYWLGGKDHFEADRAAGDEAIAELPDMVASVRNTRAFLGRTVRFLTQERGIRQFLDVGTGIPTAANTHEVAQGIAPESRIVYVDNDPMVLAHARALLSSNPEGRTAYIQADLRSPLDILSSPVVRSVIDFGEPVALMLIAVLHFLEEADEPGAVLSTLLDALPSGSYLAASHMTLEHDPVGVGGGQRAYHKAGLPMRARDADEFASLAFCGLDLVPPGVVLVSEWRPESKAPRPTAAEVSCYGGVARKR